MTLPSFLKILGGFSGNNLTNIAIPNSVTQILDLAFQGNQLTNITIPNSVTQIGDGSFSNNQLTNITIPNSVRYIDGESTFGFNPNLTTIKNETGRNFNWSNSVKSYTGSATCTMTTGNSNSSFITGNCNFSYPKIVNGVNTTISGTVNITN